MPPISHSEIEGSIQQRWDRVVGAFPNRPAVVTQQECLTYAVLDQLSTAIGGAILAAGADRRQPVALLLENRSQIVVAVLGVIKSGRPYAVLDPSYPPERLRFMLADLQPGMVITNSQGENLLPDRPILNLDQTLEEPATQPAFPVPSAGDRAYIVYTSGSTGQPKGIVHSHRNLLQNIRAYTLVLQVNPQDRISGLHSPAFSSSVQETFYALLNGASLYPWDTKTVGFDGLAEWIRQNQISIINWGPTPFKGWLELERDENRPVEAAFPAVRVVMLGNEPVTGADFEWFKKAFCPPCAFINRLGASETNLTMTFQAGHHTHLDGPRVPSGYAVEGKEIILLAENDRPARPGETGEIVVRSRYLALEYWNRPELSAAMFQPVPGSPGERVYRTGDLGRLLPDGCLEYSGRKDTQVKIRGQRVEVAEVEQALLKCSGIREAAVVSATSAAGETRLVAYLVLRPAQQVTSQGLRDELRKMLPEYMLPAEFRRLDALPLSPTGKLDRAALSDLSSSHSVSKAAEAPLAPQGVNYVPPRTAAEKALADIWSQVLGDGPIGREDDFFARGGHSLLAGQVIGRVRQAFNQELTLRAIFENPTLAGLAARLESENGTGSRLTPPGPRALAPVSPRPEKVSLSYGQLRLWLLEQFEPNTPVFNIHDAFRLHGPLNRPALQAALGLVQARHESLRTIFPAEDGQPYQQILPAGAFNLPYEDLSALPVDEREPRLLQQAEAEIRRPFSLERDLPLRARLLRLAEGEHLFIVVVHHIASDFWSKELFWRELNEAYTAFCQERQPTLPALPVQYADYALWQREWLQGELMEREVRFYRERLDGLPPFSLLPDRPQPAVLSHAGGVLESTLPLEMQERLRHLAIQEGVTLHMLLLAAFGVLLYRYSGQVDLALGLPATNRRWAEIEPSIGFFVNLLILRLDFSGEPGFDALLQRVRAASLQVLEHQDLPFEKLVEELQPERNLGRTPFFQAVFQLLSTTWGRPELFGLDLTRLSLTNGMSQFDLEMTVFDEPQGLHCRLTYSREKFSSGLVQRLLTHYQVLLEGILAQPVAAIHHLPLLTPAEWQQLVVDWNDTAVTYPRADSLHHLFELQVQKTPQATALEAGEETLTYLELDNLANRLAAGLQAAGVHPGSFVGICLPRTPGLIAGLLAILKCGSAYLPLDSHTPARRLSYMIADAGVKFVLTEGDLAHALDFSPAAALLVTEILADSSRMDNSRPDCQVSGDAPLYIMYTSGSTGSPKGVVVRHRSAARLVWEANYARLEPGRRILQLATVAFDAATFEIWAALLHGGTLVLAPDGLPDYAVLQALIQERWIDTLWLTASLFNHIIDERPEILRGVEQLLTGGEALSVPHIRRALQALPGTQLINGYGPTETTTFACCYPIPPTLEEGASSIPIGRPINNTQVYVLDAWQQPVPVGIPGELYIGGDGLAAGYLNQPELTAEKFVPVPPAIAPYAPQSSQLYRSGDLARWRADGVLEFLGRRDQQIKLRGFRVELGEVEAELKRQPGVHESGVVVWHKDRTQDDRSERKLIAYYTGDPAGPTPKDLRQGLAQVLPDYMIPATIIRLDELPRNANGKLDRQALLERIGSDQEAPFEGMESVPATTLESTLQGIFARVLGVAQVEREDRFFEQGGHSLLALKLFAQIEEQLGVKLPTSTIFTNSSPAALAPLIEKVQNSGGLTERTLAIIRPGDNRPPLFLIHGYGGGLSDYRYLAELLPSGQPVVGLQAAGLQNESAPDPTIKAMASRYVAALQRAQVHGPYFLAGYCYGGVVAYEVARQLMEQGETTALLGILEGYPPNCPRPVRQPSPLRLIHVLRELPHWLQELSPARWPVLRRRFRRHWRLWQDDHLAAGEAPEVADVLGCNPAELNPNHLELMKQHLHALRSYHPQPYGGRVTLFVGYSTPGKGIANALNPSRGWERLAKGGVKVRRVQGTHHNIHLPPNVHSLAKALWEEIQFTSEHNAPT